MSETTKLQWQQQQQQLHPKLPSTAPPAHLLQQQQRPDMLMPRGSVGELFDQRVHAEFLPKGIYEDSDEDADAEEKKVQKDDYMVEQDECGLPTPKIESPISEP